MFGFLKRKFKISTAEGDTQRILEIVPDPHSHVEAPKALEAAKEPEIAKEPKALTEAREVMALEEVIESKPIDPVLELKKTITELQAENELKLIQLVQLQEQLETTFLKEQDLQVQLENLAQVHKETELKNQALLKEKIGEFEPLLQKLTQEKEQVNKARVSTEKELQTSLAELQMLKTELQTSKLSADTQSKLATAKQKELTDLLSSQGQLNNEKTKIQDQLAATNKELSDLKIQIDQIQKDKDQINQQKELVTSDKNKLAAENAQQKKAHQGLSGKFSDQEQQNELLLLQMHQLQEEVEELFLDKQKISQAHDLQLARWERLEKAMPSYIDFGSLELLNVEEALDASITHWRIHDYYQSGATYDQLDFTIVFRVGEAGIALGHELNEKNIPLYPARVTSNQRQLELFRFFSNADWKKLSNALTIMESTIKQGWTSLIKPGDFDPRFWQGALLDLIIRFRKLPPVLRYDKVVLKRELHNIDYEHLWLEVLGVQLGNISIPKLDFRIGASLVRPDGFSRHPKFEFPLLDRKHKPFESWYPESNDEHGPKFELRYDLDKKAMDMAALMKLTQSDQALVVGLIMLSTRFVQDLITQRISIHRPWVSWAQFAQEASELTSLMIRASQVQQTPVPEIKVVTMPISTVVKEELSIERPVATKLPTKVKTVAIKAPVKKLATKKTTSTKTVTKKTYPAKVATKATSKAGKVKAKK